jgi:hypothetical protein
VRQSTNPLLGIVSIRDWDDDRDTHGTLIPVGSPGPVTVSDRHPGEPGLPWGRARARA